MLGNMFCFIGEEKFEAFRMKAEISTTNQMKKSIFLGNSGRNLTIFGHLKLFVINYSVLLASALDCFICCP